MKDKTVLISGGTRGIGKGIAIEFSKNGYNVVISYRSNLKLAEEVSKNLSEKGGKCSFINMFLESEQSITDAIKQIEDQFGSIDIIINNAAYSQEKPFLEISAKDWEDIMQINLRGAFLLNQKVIPGMILKKWGRIINISSIGGQWGGFNQVHYAASKAALISLTQSIAKIYSKDGITSNAISPGLILTDMSSREINSEEGKKKLQNIPVGRLGRIEEVASTALFLASKEASYITGQTINLNGGMLFS